MKQVKNTSKTLLFLPVGLLAIFAAMFFVVKREIYLLNEERLKNSFSVEAAQISRAVEDKFVKYGTLLEATRAYVILNKDITRMDWNEYVGTLDPNENLTAMTALAFIKRVPQKERVAFRQEVRRDDSIKEGGYPDFEIYPESSEGDSYVVQYVEPEAGNEKALGYDLTSDPVRFRALKLARDMNALVVTEPIVLVQDEEKTKSFLMVMPIYENGKMPTTLEERREYIAGFVAVGIKSGDLFADVMLSLPIVNLSGLSVADVTNTSVKMIPYMDVKGKILEGRGLKATEKQIDRLGFGTRIWELSYWSDKNVSVIGIEQIIPYLLLGLGILITIFSGWQILSLLGESKQLLQIERERLAAVIRGSNLGTWEWNINTGEAVVNERWAEIIGYSLDELGPMSLGKWSELVHSDDLVQAKQELQKHFERITEYYDVEIRMKHKNGNWVWVHEKGKAFKWTTDGKPLLMFGSHQDVTERREVEEKLKRAIGETERMNKLMTGRELKMIELKKEINELKQGKVTNNAKTNVG